MNELRPTDAIDLVEGLSALERFSRLNKLYLSQLTASDQPPDAFERHALLELARRSLELIDPTDLFVQFCQEQTGQAKGSPELTKQLDELLSSNRMSDSVKAGLSGRDILQLAEDGSQQLRARLADERDLLTDEIRRLQAGGRPKRAVASDDFSADAELSTGATLVVGGAAILVAVALAPKAAAAAAVIGGAAAGGFLVGAGAAFVVEAFTHD